VAIILWLFHDPAFAAGAPAENGASSPGTKATMADPYPYFENALQNVGNIELGVTNDGDFIYGHFVEGRGLITCVFPRGSELQYLEGVGLMIGGILGDDTLVSTGYSAGIVTSEFAPDSGGAAAIQYRSILLPSTDYNRDAVSEQDFVCFYTDTVTNPGIIVQDPYDNRPHKPLHIRIDQRSYAWGFDYSQDFVLFDMRVTNIGTQPIKKMYIGIGVDPKMYHLSQYTIYQRPLVGFKDTIQALSSSCFPIDTLNIAWSADNDGDPNESGEWDYMSLRSVIGLLMLNPVFDKTRYNFNWYSPISDWNWGPRRAVGPGEEFRDFGDGLGWPKGDRNKYYFLSHPEFDYDQLFSAVDHTGYGFMPLPTVDVAGIIAGGVQARYLLSFGPYDLAPGDSVPFTFAIIGGENFHVNPSDYADYFTPYDPQVYYNKLDFSDLAKNARWARMVYDNPGVDTDGDGYRGEFCWQYTWRPDPDNPAESIAVDSFRNYYTGDSIPDFKAVAPPPPPVVRTIPEFGKVTIRWNGQESETTPDIFSGQVDFEGYRVYMSRDDRLTDFVLLASYDIDDYIVFAYDATAQMWRKITNSARTDSLKALYGDQFDANDYYDEYHYFVDPHTGRIMYFKRQDWNQSDLSNPLGIHKVYPDASPDDSTDNTEEGYRRCYEYEYTIDNLQPSVPYYFAVTAFDYGAYQYDIGQLETSPTTNAIREFALSSTDTVEHKGLNVIVYPNPYRIDAGYARAGYENRDRTKAAAWARRIHFANLPEVCTIRIFTLSGDLVREIKHWCPGGGPSCQHEEWNVISRNTQSVVTGIYIWSVRSDMGEQLGKLVIIK